jgi:light-regulated signal transduction histidine kinase (bacteriophytochrome)
LKEIKLLNEELEQRVQQRTAQLEATNEELESFSYSVSHDLRAPLRSINGFSEALLEDYGDRLEDEGRDYLGRVKAASERMGHLIDGLLELSRVTRSKMSRERIDLSALAMSVIQELKQRHPERQVEIVIENGLVAEGNERLLRVALENLLSNAWKLTGNQPHARIEFGSAEHESASVYFVRDNGSGFDMAYSDKLFGAFQRLHKVSEFPGTGIGLATVQRIIRRHGGSVWGEGAVGQGATFYFTL